MVVFRNFLIGAVFTVGLMPTWAQQQANSTRFAGEAGFSNLPGQKIGPNDLIAVSVYDSPELTRTARLTADGLLRLPMLKEPLKASGLLPSDVEVLIADALKRDGILVDPVVTVTIVEYSSRPINVVGAVKRPITFQATGNVTLLEAIGRAEGLAENAGPSILISRADDSNPLQKNLVARMDVRDLIDKAKPELNIPLYGGEEIRVPEAKKIFVAGNVKKPGGILVKEGKPITVLQALAMSEGLTPYYKKTIFILRPNEDGPKREIPIELPKILDRKSEDVELQPEDILYVPDNNRKRVTIAILDKATSFSLATISGVLIWRQR